VPEYQGGDPSLILDHLHCLDKLYSFTLPPEGTIRPSGAMCPPGGHSHGGHRHETCRHRKRWVLPLPDPHGGSHGFLVHPAPSGHTRPNSRSLRRRRRNRQSAGQATQLRDLGLRVIPPPRRKSSCPYGQVPQRRLGELHNKNGSPSHS